jgi:hypothetical protein
MIKFATIFAAATLAISSTAAFAEVSAPVTLTHKGVSYTYTVEAKDDVKIIRGTTNLSNKPFVLYVNNRMVTGKVEGSDVSFPLRAVKPLKGVFEVAAR